VALPFARSADFPVDKAAGRPCTHLQPDLRCAIHDRLREKGYRGCATFDCFGAGQRVTQQTFPGADWRANAHRAREIFTAFGIVRQLHEMLVHLGQATTLVADGPLHAELVAARDRIDGLAGRDAATVPEVDVAVERAVVGELLAGVSEVVRRGAAQVDGRITRGADLAGTDLRGVDLRGADLRAAVLIAADLRGADLQLTDLLGADLRDADLRGADLTAALFVTGPQLAAARGDGRTRLGSALVRPAHWLG
jgi:hypothetical protein